MAHTDHFPSWTRHLLTQESESESALAFKTTMLIYQPCLCVYVCVFRSEVKETVVWFDTKKTEIKTKAGKLNEEEITVLEVQYKETRLTGVESIRSSVRKKMKIDFLCR